MGRSYGEKKIQVKRFGKLKFVIKYMSSPIPTHTCDHLSSRDAHETQLRHPYDASHDICLWGVILNSY